MSCKFGIMLIIIQKITTTSNDSDVDFSICQYFRIFKVVELRGPNCKWFIITKILNGKSLSFTRDGSEVICLQFVNVWLPSCSVCTGSITIWHIPFQKCWERELSVDVLQEYFVIFSSNTSNVPSSPWFFCVGRHVDGELSVWMDVTQYIFALLCLNH